jgi:hypothetical protein
MPRLTQLVRDGMICLTDPLWFEMASNPHFLRPYMLPPMLLLLEMGLQVSLSLLSVQSMSSYI